VLANDRTLLEGCEATLKERRAGTAVSLIAVLLAAMLREGDIRPSTRKGDDEVRNTQSGLQQQSIGYFLA
jgi:hypothetical protein